MEDISSSMELQDSTFMKSPELQIVDGKRSRQIAIALEHFNALNTMLDPDFQFQAWLNNK